MNTIKYRKLREIFVNWNYWKKLELREIFVNDICVCVCVCLKCRETKRENLINNDLS